MNIYKVCNNYCIGCGACCSELGIEMKKDAKGFLMPSFKKTEEEAAFLKKICPVADDYARFYAEDNVWGPTVGVYAGFSKNSDIRKKASSGGILTALSLYLLETKKVDGIIQVCTNQENPIGTITKVSSTREDVLECCGSRYAISNPWMNLDKLVESGKKYAAVAKPCDINALRRIIETNDKYKGIIYLFSFFCAGLPSEDANRKLLHDIGCDEGKCKSLTYRGNGWPGEATAVDSNGKEYRMSYEKAWGGILGRDVNTYCRLCMDGIGVAADVVCGDGWYADEQGRPIFEERDGRNIVFSRSDFGELLLKEAVEGGAIDLQNWNDIKICETIQKYQYVRRTTMSAKINAFKLLGKVTPVYDKNVLKYFAAKASNKEKLKMFLGTVKRTLQKRI